MFDGIIDYCCGSVGGYFELCGGEWVNQYYC